MDNIEKITQNAIQKIQEVNKNVERTVKRLLEKNNKLQIHLIRISEENNGRIVRNNTKRANNWKRYKIEERYGS